MTLLWFFLICLSFPIYSKRFNINDITIQDILELNRQIRFAINSSSNFNLSEFEGGPDIFEFRPLLAGIVNLVWHDCAGPIDINGFKKKKPNKLKKKKRSTPGPICDGCIDPTRIDFHGTLVNRVIDPLDIIYITQKSLDNKKWKDKMSRADFWSTASTLSLQYAAELQHVRTIFRSSNIPIASLPNIPFYFGRKDCKYSPFSNESNFEFPPLDRGFLPSFNWFDVNFGFNKQEFIALMGVHTLGKARRDSSGFAHSWQLEDDVLDNGYYVSTKNAVTMWKQILIENNITSINDDIPNRFQWVLGNPNFLLNPITKVFYERALRLNVDISFYLKVEDNLNIDTGKVSCLYKEFVSRTNECPFQDDDILNVFNVYANATNNQLWFNDFALVWNKLVTRGYNLNQLISINIP